MDTNVILRFLTSDDAERNARATKLFERVEKGELKVVVPILVIAEAVYVLSSPRLYNRSRPEIFGMLSRLLKVPGFKVKSRRTVMKALQLYLTTSLDFEDAYLAVTMLQAGPREIYSFDRDFDKVAGIKRIEP